jgi:NAD-dependent epimerase/dehydratase family protein
LLAPELIRQGYEVIGLDTGFYKERTFYRDAGTTPLTLAKDLRHVGVEAVVHMAELSNDPASQLAPNITYEINHNGSVRRRTCPLRGSEALRLHVVLLPDVYASEAIGILDTDTADRPPVLLDE